MKIIRLLVYVLLASSVFFFLLGTYEKVFAVKSSKLSFLPQSTSIAPIHKNIGDTFTLDVMIDPGVNYVSYVSLKIDYPADIIAVNKAEINTSVFSRVFEEPMIRSGSVSASISTGGDDNLLVKTTKRVATLTFTTLKEQTTPAEIKFNTQTSVLSLAPNDPATENVLAATESAYILVAKDPNAARFTYRFGLHGLGASGDNLNPNNFQFSNKNPLHPTRQISLFFSTANDQIVGSASGVITYSQQTAWFMGETQKVLTPGSYFITVQTPGYLKKRFDTAFTVGTNADIILPLTHLVAGDIDGDNQLSVLDYNQFIGCYSDLFPAKSCTPEKKVLTDITDDGKVNLQDFNLFLREFKVK